VIEDLLQPRTIALGSDGALTAVVLLATVVALVMLLTDSVRPR